MSAPFHTKRDRNTYKNTMTNEFKMSCGSKKAHPS